MAKSKRATNVKKKAKPPRSAPDTSQTPSTLPSFPIVGIGASAGGLEACTQLLHALPQIDIALIIVQHLAPEHESFLTELLAAATPMPVKQVSDGMKIKPGHVYVIPPNVQLKIADGVLRLSPRPMDRSQHMPIDFFFRSLAEYAQSRAIG
ncbi:MAG TPA: chemotaxis protein CheB, partial [Tepidisphaeraceae bacterium]|nr:chemotaxis protein CheB [Tepidisphaeraceae bacterium]